MHLTLNVVRCPDAAVPESRRSSGTDIAIGRGHESDWVLPDPERVLSKRHCVVEFRGGYWQVRDISTNGTFLNHAAEPVGREMVAPLSDGDRLRLGSYEIEVRIAAAAGIEAPVWGQPALGAPVTPGGGRPTSDPFADPFPPAPAVAGGGALPGIGGTVPGGTLPEDWDPFADEPPMPDHQPATSDAFLPPPNAPAAKLPEDWDPGLGGPAAASPPVSPAGGGLPADWDPLADLSPPPPPPPAFAPPVPAPAPAPQPPVLPPPAPPVAAPEPMPGPAEPPLSAPPADPFAEEGVPAAPAMAAPPLAAATSPAPSAPAPALAAALAALLRGAGLSPTALPGADPLAVIEQAGAALAASVAGLRALLIARADVKREFRIEQTMLRAAGNNPVKFAATEEAALAALLSGPVGPKAVQETVGDLTAHQVASLAATQAAARALLQRLAPEGLEAAEAGGGLFASREKRLWEAYKRLHAQVTEQFEDDFDSAFGKEFARAYEQATRR